MSELSAAEIKKKFPNEWEVMQGRVAKKSKPELPRSLQTALKKECRSLLDGRLVDLPATAAQPFIARCLLMWEEGDCCEMNIVDAILPRKKASKCEKTLVNILNSLDSSEIRDDIWDRVNSAGSRVTRDFNREIKAFLKKGTQLEKKYRFDLTDFIEGIQF